MIVWNRGVWYKQESYGAGLQDWENLVVDDRLWKE